MALPVPEGTPKTKRGKRLTERLIKDSALRAATEQGYQDLQDGRVSKLEDVKRKLGDV